MVNIGKSITGNTQREEEKKEQGRTRLEALSPFYFLLSRLSIASGIPVPTAR